MSQETYGAAGLDWIEVTKSSPVAPFSPLGMDTKMTMMMKSIATPCMECLSVLPIRLPTQFHQVLLTVKQHSFNSLHPNIRMHILHTVFHTFLTVLTRRI